MESTPWRRHRRTMTLTLAAAALTLAACGDDSDEAGGSGDTLAPAVTASDSTVPDDPTTETAGAETTADATSPDTPASGATEAPGASDGTTGTDGTASDPATTPGDTTAETSADPSAGTASPASAPAGSSDVTTPGTTPGTGAAAPAAAPTTPTTPTPVSYEIVEGDTLYAIAQDNDVTVEELVAANGWPEGDAHIIQPGEVIQIPTAAIEPEPVSAEEVLELELTDGVSAPIAEPLVDGVYFALSATPNTDGTALVLPLVQFETTEACEARLAAETPAGGTIDDAECLGYHVIEEPSASVEVPLDDPAPVVVLLAAPPDVVDLLAVETTVDVWSQLIAGDGPDWAADWLPGGAFVQITDGAVTRIEVSVVGS